MDESGTNHRTAEEPAERVRISYPANLSDWGRSIVDGEPFRAYLRRVQETAAVGDVWEEFVGVGCCGDTLDVPLRVEAVEGGPAIDDATRFEFEEREQDSCGGGWAVQSGASP